MGWLSWQSIDSRSNGFHDQRFKPRLEHKNKFVSESCCADSLSVCPTPVCIHLHKNGHVHTLQPMSEFGGLRKHYTLEKTPWVAPYCGCSLSLGKAAQISHSDKKLSNLITSTVGEKIWTTPFIICTNLYKYETLLRRLIGLKIHIGYTHDTKIEEKDLDSNRCAWNE